MSANNGTGAGACTGTGDGVAISRSGVTGDVADRGSAVVSSTVVSSAVVSSTRVYNLIDVLAHLVELLILWTDQNP